MMLRSIALLGFLILTVAHGQEGNTIPPTRAQEHDGEICTIEFVVKSARKVKNSNRGPHTSLTSSPVTGPDTVAVLIPDSAASQFSVGVGKIEKHYTGKQIRVTGKVQVNKSKVPEIWITSPKQIAITNARPEPDPHDTPPPSTPLSDDFDPTPPSYLMYYFIGGGAVLLLVWFAIKRFQKPTSEESDT